MDTKGNTTLNKVPADVTEEETTCVVVKDGVSLKKKTTKTVATDVTEEKATCAVVKYFVFL